ncbi:hypothetical protein [Emticicia sp. C21]|uniref:hypothetical protein n=1 Tax=Emticicia sp. C21 TaxID=2302915 RepID=UPI0011C19F42|nr:hypothetical protein [Emticicia sp. C21]
MIPTLAIALAVLFGTCLLLGLKLYQALRDNATLQHQNACFTAESSQEKTFAEIYADLTKIIKEIRQINRRLENHGSGAESTHLRH